MRFLNELSWIPYIRVPIQERSVKALPHIL